MVTLKGSVPCFHTSQQQGLIDPNKKNILIDEEGNVRITDFGLITVTESQALGTDFTAHTGKGSVRWMAPELFGPAARITRSTDVYAFGVTIHEVCTYTFASIFGLVDLWRQIYTNSVPFAGYLNDIQIVMAITQGTRPSRPPELVEMHEDLWTLVTRCWKTEPHTRPSMRVVDDTVSVHHFKFAFSGACLTIPLS